MLLGVISTDRPVLVTPGGHFFYSPTVRSSAEIGRRPEEGQPLLYNFTASRLDNSHDISEGSVRNMRAVVAQETLSCARNPYLCRARRRSALRDMNMNRLKRIVFIRPEVNPVGANLKNLRHFRRPPPRRTQESGAPLTE